MSETNGKATIREVYDLVAKLEQKMDRRLQGIQDQLRRRDDDHEGRIRLLERWRYGIGASLLAAIGALGAVIAELVRSA